MLRNRIADLSPNCNTTKSEKSGARLCYPPPCKADTAMGPVMGVAHASCYRCIPFHSHLSQFAERK
jgi:hypothetical protein